MTYKQKGMSILEIMVVVSIIVIVVAVGAPSIVESQRTLRLKGAVESSYFMLQSARSVAISKATDSTVVFNGNAPWCLGISDSGNCDCQTVNSCTVDNVEHVLKQADFPNIALDDINFGDDGAMIFDGQRGFTLNDAGNFVLSDNGIEMRIEVSRMGRVSICTQTGSLGSYNPC